MKNLTKILPMLVFLLSLGDVYAQNIRVRGGLNASNMLSKDDDETYSSDFKPRVGFNLGLSAEFSISENFSFEPSLMLSTKGFRTEEKSTEPIFVNGVQTGSVEVESKGNWNTLYLDIPLTFKASKNLGSATIYGLFGPYIGLGLSGKTKFEATAIGITVEEEESIKWGSDEEKDDLKPLELGLAFGGGVEVKSLQIGFLYGLGLNNISPFDSNGYRTKNRVFSLTLGYKIFGK